MFALGMITAPRYGLNVNESIAEFRRGGFSEPLHIFCEPGTERIAITDQVVVHRNATIQGVVGNWTQCLRWLHANTSSSYLIVAEDDVIYCPSARRTLQHGIERISLFGYLSAYNPRRNEPLMLGRKGWVELNRGRDSWGTLCMCFSRDSAWQLIESGALDAEEQLRGPTDYAVADFFLRTGIPCFYHNPSLADHIGRISTVGHNWYNECLGLDFARDADLPTPEIHLQRSPVEIRDITS